MNPDIFLKRCIVHLGFSLLLLQTALAAPIPRQVAFSDTDSGFVAVDLGNGYTGMLGYDLGGESGDVMFNDGRGAIEWSGHRQNLLYLHPVEQGQQYHGQMFQLRETKSGVRSRHLPLWLSILPPLIAIVFALAFREVIISLFAGVVIGAWAFFGFSIGGLPPALFKSVDLFIIDAFTDSGHASVIIFSMLIGGMVAIISRNGGMLGVVHRLSRFANSARNAQFVTWFMGVAIFFDDYANTLIVGNTLRPVTDRFRVSREKLAYIVDSTAAPVAAIALVTTWIGAELGYIKDALDVSGIEANEYLLFLQSLKYAHYPVLTLIFIFMLIWLNRDFGPMYKAEHRARTTGRLMKDEGLMQEMSENLDPDEGIRLLPFNAVIPVLTVIGVTIFGLVATGMNSLFSDLSAMGAEPAARSWGAIWTEVPALFPGNSDPGFFLRVGKLIGSSDSYVALLWASSAGVAVAILLSMLSRTLDLERSMNAMLSGFKTMLPTMLILILAWSLAGTTEYLHTADFLISRLSSNLNVEWVPLFTFILAGLISFSTGSSWSTMAILYPLALPLTWSIGVNSGMPEAEIMPIFHNVIAVVLAGSVLGDHCSPISDTTVLSSLASSCHHIDHVRTQLPYALTVGAVSILVGDILPSFIHLPWYITFVLGIFLLYSVIKVAGKRLPLTV